MVWATGHGELVFLMGTVYWVSYLDLHHQVAVTGAPLI